ncbi:MAG: RlmE family RNA methyltransferase [Thermoplasmata archaeon]
MTKRWIRERKTDVYHREARRRGYRSRAAFKLIQINEKFGVIKEGDFVVDLGAAPGGWSQVAQELVRDRGRVVAVDRKRMSPIEGVTILRGDLRKPETLSLIHERIGKYIDVVISDMAPRLSGNRHVDHARSIALAEIALEFATRILKKGGNFLAKVLQGDMFSSYLENTSRRFAFCRAHTPKASLSRSREIFVVAKDFRG